VVVVAGDVVAVLPIAGLVDFAVERARLEKELEQARQEASRLNGQLGNASFVERAPANVVEAQRQRLAVVTEKIEVLQRRVAQLGE
jgi:valyl-tRNA synthetase